MAHKSGYSRPKRSTKKKAKKASKPAASGYVGNKAKEAAAYAKLVAPIKPGQSGVGKKKKAAKKPVSGPKKSRDARAIEERQDYEKKGKMKRGSYK